MKESCKTTIVQRVPTMEFLKTVFVFFIIAVVSTWANNCPEACDEPYDSDPICGVNLKGELQLYPNKCEYDVAVCNNNVQGVDWRPCTAHDLEDHPQVHYGTSKHSMESTTAKSSTDIPCGTNGYFDCSYLHN
ncbi:uncharacterized protein LOC123290402 [Chrysoperla carnea]|uniref:uncharacterized protein LOC123290402 n=1 Tax=Chrysoperla carnea TaxID=189513 RepID=UPI001D08EB57|nr:uncharacterized protein LOC123290402 [Chrysoperla carnea]